MARKIGKFRKNRASGEKVLKRDKIYDILNMYIRKYRTGGGMKMKDENKSGKFRLWDLVPVWAIVLFAVFIAAFAVELISKSNKALADAINDGSGPVIRLALAKMTRFLPF